MTATVRVLLLVCWGCTIGRVKDEKSQLGITAICFFGTILYGETEFTALLRFWVDWGVQKIGWKYGRKYKGFPKFIREKMSDTYFIFFSFIQFYSQNRISGCDCWGPDGRLDTKINKFDLCHISMSYVSYVIIWHIMSYDAYDIEIWHKSIWPIWVSKRPSGPQQSHPLLWFGQTTNLKIEKIRVSFWGLKLT